MLLVQALRNCQADRYVSWKDVMITLDQWEKDPPSAVMLSSVNSQDWKDALSARFIIAVNGAKSMLPLADFAASCSGKDRKQILELMRFICEETKRALGKSGSIFCSHCFILPSPHKALRFTYYSCQHCNRNRHFISAPNGVIAIIDQNMQKDKIVRDGALFVNWIKHGRIFDFDRVEIINATDNDIDKFVLQVESDVDDYRKPRYKKMTVNIHPGCQLSRNSIMNLEMAFGKVVVVG